MGYTLILTFLLLKLVYAVYVLGTAELNVHIHGTAWQTLIFLTTYFSFDEVSLKSEVKLGVIMFLAVIIIIFFYLFFFIFFFIFYFFFIFFFYLFIYSFL